MPTTQQALELETSYERGVVRTQGGLHFGEPVPLGVVEHRSPTMERVGGDGAEGRTGAPLRGMAGVTASPWADGQAPC